MLHVMQCKLLNLELVAFVQPLVPLEYPVENGIEWSQN